MTELTPKLLDKLDRLAKEWDAEELECIEFLEPAVVNMPALTAAARKVPELEAHAIAQADAIRLAFSRADALAAQVETLRSALQRHHDFKGIAEALATTPPAALEAHDKRVRTEALAKGAAACAQMASECPFGYGAGYDAYIDCQRALLDLMDE